MGQKVGGYRRNVKYGQQTTLLKGDRGWVFEVNPKGRVGWEMGTCGRKEKEYGETYNESKRLRKELEEVMKNKGRETNGLGRRGTKEMGYRVYGEYRGLRTSKKGRKEENVRVTEEERKGARERVLMKYEKKRKTKIERKRTELYGRRKERGLGEEWEERKKGPGEKRGRGDERSAAVVLSGKRPVNRRRVNLISRELEGGLNHMEVMRNRERVRTQHARRSQDGRKRLGEGRKKGGYYGVKVVVKGPLDGARRSLAYQVERGTVPRGTKRARRRSSRKHAKTNVGARGLEVTYCYGRG